MADDYMPPPPEHVERPVARRRTLGQPRLVVDAAPILLDVDRAQVAALGVEHAAREARRGVLAARLALADADEALQAAEQRRDQCRRDLEEAREIQRRAEVARG